MLFARHHESIRQDSVHGTPRELQEYALNQSMALIGECMIELHGRPESELKQGFAGDTFNTAVYFARLTRERAWQVEYVSAVGSDAFSEAMLARWTREGVGHALTARLANRLPGLYVIETDDEGERHFHYWRSEAAARHMFDDEAEGERRLEQLAGFDTLYLSGITLAILTASGRERLLEALARARLHGTRVVFDNNYRPQLWGDPATARQHYRALLEHVDLALVTFEDDRALYGFDSVDALLAHYAEIGIEEVVIKRGAQSCIVMTAQGREEIAGETVEQVVDTTAAGDAFSAGYLACRLQGGSSTEAARQGHRLAATVIRHRGAIIDAGEMPVMT
ncbi:2-keto-3-deoxygluconate kinase [Kushneria sinocarnis]|uniref:2-dehydro-3-deoxygluconokinase n=1 Tax=Kushneria sinocarnis TaxID=595502 RepID=A0A420WX97_9GAMM|nr:2-keto-3-deoxygluconate kinase [Kushneria sinocarnis]